LLFSDSPIDSTAHTTFAAPPKSKNIDDFIRVFSEDDEDVLNFSPNVLNLQPLRKISYDDKYGITVINVSIFILCAE
jgi:hypothetical protein